MRLRKGGVQHVEYTVLTNAQLPFLMGGVHFDPELKLYYYLLFSTPPGPKGPKQKYVLGVYGGKGGFSNSVFSSELLSHRSGISRCGPQAPAAPPRRDTTDSTSLWKPARLRPQWTRSTGGRSVWPVLTEESAAREKK